MLTRCPSCSTAFRVTPEQLKARAGKVRCGHCNAVFNALETLEDAQIAAAQPEPEAGTVAGSAPDESHAASGASSSIAEPVEDPLEGQATAIESPAEEAGIEEPPPESALAPARRVSRWRIIAWGFGAVSMLALLCAQAAFIYRSELAISQPDLRPLLEEMCAALGCDLPLPRMSALVAIDVSDLHPDPKQKNLLVLAATLKNRAPFAQAYPHLELTLTDIRDQPLARRVFLPADYLAQGTDINAGFAANGELALSLWLDAASVAASGYSLYLFYP
jgi:predicted Zn finger-like uncharacterized protein